MVQDKVIRRDGNLNLLPCFAGRRVAELLAGGLSGEVVDVAATAAIDEALALTRLPVEGPAAQTLPAVGALIRRHRADGGSEDIWGYFDEWLMKHHLFGQQ